MLLYQRHNTYFDPGTVIFQEVPVVFTVSCFVGNHVCICIGYWITDIQGVPRNMTIARRLESRLWYLNLFVSFSLLSTLTCMILETIIT